MTTGASFRREEFTIAIVGGGASGTLVASMLVRRSRNAKVVIIEPSERLGRGVAYATLQNRSALRSQPGANV
jgi:uncharacterized NAD(P)/FAD-binding protein YdhS